MIVYFLSCILSMFLVYLGLHTDRGKNLKGVLAFFSSMPLILVAALRYDVGEDYLSGYVSYYEMVEQNLLVEGQQMDLLFHWLNQAVAEIQGGYVMIFTVCAVVFYCCIFSQLIQDSPAPALSVFLLTGMGFVFIFFNAMRQMVGCAILLWSIRFIREKKLLPFLICVAIASGFHSTNALFVLAYFWTRIRIKPWLAAVLTAVVIGLILPVTAIVREIMKATNFGVYLESEFDTGRTAWVTIFINVVLVIVYSIFYRDDEKYRLYYNLALIALWVTFFSGKIVLSIRLSWMFSLPSIISLPMAVGTMKNRNNRFLFKCGIVLLYTAYTIITVGIQNSNSVLPYQTVLGR